MNDHILNVINHLLCYSDGVVTDNPHQRAIDNRLRLESIAVKNPYGASKTLAPGESFQLFANTIASGLSGTSVLDLDLVGTEKSVYRLSLTAGSGAFRTARVVSGISTCNVTINNSALAVFDFAGATLSSVQVGDLMRINGQDTYDTGPYAFNPINSGIWKVIGVSGTAISAVREIGSAFTGIQESIATSVASDVMFYADDLIRKGMKFQVSGTLSPVSHRTFEVLSSTSTFIDFVSTEPIPEESGLTYVSGSIIFYTSVKKLVYVEADQECSVRFNGATDDSNKITPIKTGDRLLRGFLNKMGDTFSCEVVNKSINTCNMKFFTVE
jgi:hypothetical protein